METRLKNIELLAPAGRWAALEAVLSAGADAVYLAGKEYNMRRHRSDFNFSRDEIARAAEKIHTAGARIYIAVNSLLSERELQNIGEYLVFLESIAVDALIVQDLGLIQLITRSGFRLPLHASTMMNIHSAEGARACAGSGISRVICSRDITLHQVRQMRDCTGLEMEYFVHGDMCIAQAGQCYMSGVLFGRSSNRGQCMKPCRWSYQMISLGGGVLETKTDGLYLLAAKDICLVEFLPELIEAGVSALKIEGRMRAPGYLAGIVGVYRRALDRYRSDPFGYVNDIHDYHELHRNRVRDFSSCCALRRPGASLVGSSGTREPFFLSTGVKEKEIDLLHPEDVFPGKRDGQHGRVDQASRVLLAVHVGSPESAREALDQGADWIYLGGEVFPSRGQRWGLSSLKDIFSRARDQGKNVGLLTPRVTLARQLDELRWFLDQAGSVAPDAVLVHNLGSLYLVRAHSDIPVCADFSFNVLNRRSIEYLSQLGARQVTLSPEASFETLKDLAGSSRVPLECIIHGPVTGMYLEHCLMSMTLMNTSSHDPCRGPCRYLQCGLSDKLQQIYPIEVDQYCRTHILFSKDLACLNYVADFVQTGVRTLRIEGQYYEKELVGMLTGLYADLIANPFQSMSPSRLKRLIAMSPRGFSLGAYPKGICEDASPARRGSAPDPARAFQEPPVKRSSAH